MLNGRDDNKYEGSDDSEYHFSDEEVNYEAEPESDKSAAPRDDGHGGDVKSTGSGKKMLIGLAVFFGLVFVTYKMVSPGSVVPPTDIAPQAAAPAVVQQQAMPQVAQQQAAAPQQQQPVQQSASPSAQQPTQQASAEQPSAIQQMQQMVVQQPQDANPVQQAPTSSPQSAPGGQQAPDMVVAQPYQSSAPVPDNSGMPQVIPVQTAPSVSATGSSMSAQAADAAAALASENSKLSRQLESEYAQRITEYQSQNKNLQEQVQTLNGRVANMESEMNQLIQTLTQQFQGGGSAPVAASTSVGAQAAAPVEQAGPPPRVPYNVQAIIPGRAWLRANNGDTLTVAEGDDIKGIGRVTKIDPYDGIVEINVQGRSVSLSYGNGS